MRGDLSAVGVSLRDDPGPLGGRGGQGGQEGQQGSTEHGWAGLGWAGLGWRVEMEESRPLILEPGLDQGVKSTCFQT